MTSPEQPRRKPLRPSGPRPSRTVRGAHNGNHTKTPRSAEWHHQAPADRTLRWNALVDWVAWLSDRYELSRGERLPHCWYRHPGLIEELEGLKTWREQVYSDPEHTGRDIRAWHIELHHVLALADSFYARGCKAGHKEPDRTTESEEGQIDQWRAGDPMARTNTTARRQGAPHADSGTYTSDPTMHAALVNGSAQPLAPGREQVVRYRGGFWVKDTEGYRRVTRPQTIRELNQAAVNLADAARNVALIRDERAVLEQARAIVDTAANRPIDENGENHI